MFKNFKMLFSVTFVEASTLFDSHTLKDHGNRNMQIPTLEIFGSTFNSKLREK